MPAYIFVLILIAYYILVLSLAVGVVLDNKNPAKTLAYLLVMLFVPIGGLVVYFLFGQNLRKQKLFSRKGFFDNANVREWQEARIKAFEAEAIKAKQFLGEKIKVVNLLTNNEGATVTHQNEVDFLVNGENIFPKMFDDMRAAKAHLHIEFYIVDDDTIGQEFKEILIYKAQEGVEVRFCYDDVGSRKLPRKYIRELKEAGVEVYPFMQVFFPFLTSKLNFRNHRKIVVIDGVIGYFGGINIADRYTNQKPELQFWRDTHVRIYGEAVKYLQMQFMLNWNFVSGKALPIEAYYFPNVEAREKHMLQISSSGPDTDWPSIMQAILMSINTAQKYVYITTPYFIPNEEVMAALQTAALSGIDVQLLIPKKGDSWLTHAAAMSYVRQLLNAGVKVHMYTKGFVHAKSIVVDDLIASVGTTNMDNRSFELNFEINAFCYDEELAKILAAQFETDKETSEELSLERWQRRRIRKRVTESFARMFAPLL